MCTSAAMVGAGLNLGARRDPQGVRYLIRHFLLMPPRGYPHIEMTHSTKTGGTHRECATLKRHSL